MAYSLFSLALYSIPIYLKAFSTSYYSSFSSFSSFLASFFFFFFFFFFFS